MKINDIINVAKTTKFDQEARKLNVRLIARYLKVIFPY